MKKCISILICSALLLALGCGAFAMVQGDIDEHEMAPGLEAALDYARQVIEADRGKTLEELSDENNANYYHYNPYGHTVPPEPAIAAAKDQTWDDIVSMLFEKYGISPDEPNIALTYYNTVTGESYRYNAPPLRRLRPEGGHERQFRPQRRLGHRPRQAGQRQVQQPLHQDGIYVLVS